MALLAVLCVFVGLLLGVLYAAVLIFRVACRWCRLDAPSVPKAAGIVFVSWFVWTVAEAVLLATTQEVYDALGYPYWEARVVCFFVGLPLNLAVSAVLHVALMRVPLGKAVEVWFVQYLILLSLVLGVVGLFAVALLAGNG